jgi:hypothetical protein
VSTTNRERAAIFISYSHADADWLKRLRVHLRPLERDYDLDIWDDTRIKSGSRWRQEIKRALDAADAAVLLVSADFLASDFIRNDELPPLLLGAERRGIAILTIILSPCRFEREDAISQFQSVNSPTKPLTSLTRNGQGKVFVALAAAVEEKIRAAQTAAHARAAQPPASPTAKPPATVSRFSVEDLRNPWAELTKPWTPQPSVAPEAPVSRLGTKDDAAAPTAPASKPVIIASSDLGYAARFAWKRDWALRRQSADGVLTAENLRTYLDQQLEERAKLYARHESTSDIDYEIGTSRRMLSAMNRRSLKGISYVPEPVLELPRHLRTFYAEILNLDEDGGVSFKGEISQGALDDARSRYRTMPARFDSERERRQDALATLDELATKLHLS